eukprot:620368-Pelagomonas_calceolata.AAC.2
MGGCNCGPGSIRHSKSYWLLRSWLPRALLQVSLEKGSAAVWVHSPSQLEALSLAPALAEAVKAIGFEAKPHIDGL